MGSQKCLGLILVGFLFLSGLFLSLAQNTTTKHYEFVLKEKNFTRLCSTKSMLTANGLFPGPEIRVNKGDTVLVTVKNDGHYNVTIHWHGVKQTRNPWHDGPEYITQCPIKPGSNLTYTIIFSDEVGTVWWHAHSDWTRATVHGAILIRDPSFPFPKPDFEETVVLASWFKGDVMAMIEEALATGAETNVSDAITINGQPGDLFACSNESTYKLTVDYGKTYLLHLVNAEMNEELFLNIANHTLTVIAIDGAYIKPIKTTLIMITPGQTMDVLLTADQPPSHYYIAVKTYFTGNGQYDNTTATAIIRYNGSYTAPTTPYAQALPDYNDTKAATNFTSRFRSLEAVNLPQTVEEHMYITISVNQLPCPNSSCDGPNGNRLSASLNNISFAAPSVDILQAYYRNLSAIYSTDFPNYPPYYFNFTADEEDSNTIIPTVGTQVKMLDYNTSIEIVLQGTNLGPENHPMHFHGFSFYVVGMGWGNYNNETDPATFNLIDPPLANTLGVPREGWAAIRFVADNPGVWFMHCHLERHASWGMSTVFIVKNGKTVETSMLHPPPNMPQC